MRHRIAGNKLGRQPGLRKATIRDVAKATLIHQRICTTKAKAKEARKLVDQLITLGKKGELSHRRRAFAVLCDHGLVSRLFTKTAPRFRDRKGGYTRIIPLPNLRRGDKATMVYLELTEKDEVIVSTPKVAATATAKEIDALPRKTDGQPPEENTETSPAKSPQPKFPFLKPTAQDKVGKPGKRIAGGIKKMFQRKTGSE